MIVRPSFPRPSPLAGQLSCYRCHHVQSTLTRPKFNPPVNSLHRSFSTNPSLQEPPKIVNHYEILGVPQNVSKADLKKQFYKLSKETHPDLHKNDPTAAEKFSQISESYSILGDEEKRRRYNRDFIRENPAAAGRSGTYAGSRPASGLSKRRGTFRGAPSSFYAHGGYGGTGRQTQSAPRSEPQGGTFNAAAFTERGRYDPEFNSDPIFRTQSVEDAKRSRRMQQAIDMEAADLERNDNFWIRFIVVSTIVIAGICIGNLVMSGSPKGGMTRADGSRRDGARNDWAKG